MLDAAFNCSCMTCRRYMSGSLSRPCYDVAAAAAAPVVATADPVITLTPGFSLRSLSSGGTSTTCHLIPYSTSPDVAPDVAPAFGAPSDSTDIDDLMDRLRYFRSELQLEKRSLYNGGVFTDEKLVLLAKKDDVLRGKIRAIEDTLTVFGSFFRTD